MNTVDIVFSKEFVCKFCQIMDLVAHEREKRLGSETRKRALFDRQMENGFGFASNSFGQYIILKTLHTKNRLNQARYNQRTLEPEQSKIGFF